MQQISPFCFQLPKLLFVFILTGCETDQTVLRQNETVFSIPLAVCVVVAQILFWNIFNDLCPILVPDFYIFVGVESVGMHVMQ